MICKFFCWLCAWFSVRLASVRSVANRKGGQGEEQRGGTCRRGWGAAGWLVLAAVLAGSWPAHAELLDSMGLQLARAELLEPSESLEPVTLQLKWKHQFQFAGYYAALAQGYYREAGLNVKIVEAQEDHDPVTAVVRGDADFGVGAANLVLRRANGEPVVALAVIFQHSPQMLLARRGPDLNHIHNLSGKRVHIEPGSTELLAYLQREGITPAPLSIVPSNLDVAALIAGQTDAISAYVTDQPFAARQAGLDYLIFTPRAAGIDFYGDNLFTTEAQLQAHPQRVKAFVAASLRGWRYAMAHPEEIIELILSQYSQRHSREHLRYEAEQMQHLILPDLVELGYMNPDRWRHMADTYIEQGLLPAGISLQGFLYEADPKSRRLLWLYRILAAAVVLTLLGGLILLHIYRINRRLHHEILEHKTAEAKFRGLVEQSLVGIYIIQDDRFVYANPRLADMFGYTLEEIVGRLGPLDLIAQSDREQVRENLRRRLDGEIGSIRYTFSAVRRDGRLMDIEVNGKVVDYEGRPAIVGVALDVTEQKRAQQQLSYLAFYDPLTDLPNRALLFDRLSQILIRSKRDGARFALLLLDLDGFKAVNDGYGHETGDALLQAVGRRLRNCVRESDTVARMGGDEFVILLPRLGEPSDAIRVAGKVIEALAEPFLLAERECRVGASIGFCIAPDDGDDMEALLSHADAAMYQSKTRGKNVWTRYEPTLPNGKLVKIAFLDWSEEFSIGVPVIDSQHAWLMLLLNGISDAVKTGQPEEQIQGLLDELIAFTRYHFESEERLMRQYGYAETLIHQQAHRKLLEDLLSIQRRFESASLMLTLQSLKDWLIAHVTGSDRRLGEALIAAGMVKASSS